MVETGARRNIELKIRDIMFLWIPSLLVHLFERIILE